MVHYRVKYQIWKMEHESTAGMNSLLLTEILGSSKTSIENKNNFGEIVFVIVTEL